MTVSFLGIDLAWRSERNPSGAVALSGSAGRLEVSEVAPPLRGLREVEAFVLRHERPSTIVAIDAPLIIRNVAGQRRCERELSQRYGSQHASCHSSNLRLYPDAESVRLAGSLASLGFAHAASGQSRVMLEVYPHAAYLALFELPSIIRYKKGTVAEKCDGLRTVQRTLARLPIASGAALTSLLGRDSADLRGKERKSFEDSLDALFCAYLAYHFWQYGENQWEFFGDLQDGYIANPSVPLSTLTAASPDARWDC
jgi:predicted RNase H-like nuclease